MGAELLFALTLLVIGVKIVGWYGIWGLQAAGQRGTAALRVIRPVIRLEAGYYLVLMAYVVLAPGLVPIYLALPLVGIHWAALVRDLAVPVVCNDPAGRRPLTPGLLKGVIGFEAAEFAALIYFTSLVKWGGRGG